MKSVGKVLEWAVNALTLVIAVLLLGLLVRRYVSPTETNSPEEDPRVGASVALPGVNWTDNKVTLIMVMEVGCRWCKASAGFYADLLGSNTSRAFHPIAVLPEPVPESQAFLRSLRLTIPDVQQADFTELGVHGTPTLILVNSRGRVESTWFGKLPPDREDEVFRKLGIKRMVSSANGNQEGNLQANSEVDDPDLITADQFAHIRGRKMVPIVDIRPREEYAVGHISESVNIPMDELDARIEHEVPKDVRILMYCHYSPKCESVAKSEGIATFCADGRASLQRLGFLRVKVLSDDLAQIRAAGIGIAGVSQEQAVSTTPILSSR